MLSKTIATLKMKDVRCISACLSGSMIWFHEWICFLWDYTNYIDFLGIYTNNVFSPDETDDNNVS